MKQKLHYYVKNGRCHKVCIPVITISYFPKQRINYGYIDMNEADLKKIQRDVNTDAFRGYFRLVSSLGGSHTNFEPYCIVTLSLVL